MKPDYTLFRLFDELDGEWIGEADVEYFPPYFNQDEGYDGEGETTCTLLRVFNPDGKMVSPYDPAFPAHVRGKLEVAAIEFFWNPPITPVVIPELGKGGPLLRPEDDRTDFNQLFPIPQ